jgi:hypothetical protein
MNVITLDVREKRCPRWALLLPGVYLAAAAAAVRSVLVNGGDIAVFGTLLAVGLVCAFAVPAVFTSRSARLVMRDDDLMIDGRLVKVDDARIELAERGSALLHLLVRSGETRSFIVAFHKDAQRIVAMLPPASAPSGALGQAGA